MNILIVDDSNSARKILKKHLEKEHCRIFEAENGQKALEFANKKGKELDAVITDYEMPDITGTQVAESIKNQYPNIPVIMVTGFDNTSIVIEAGIVKNCIDDFISKPVNIKCLLLRVQQAKDRIQKRVESEKTQKMIQQKLIQSHNLETIGLLSSGIAHDFNNLLYVISGNAEYLLSKNKFNESDRICIQDIKGAANFGKSIVEQIFFLSKKAPRNLEVIDFKQTIHEVLKLIQNSFPLNTIVKLDIDKNISNIKADKSQVCQIIINLCLNATQAMENGGILTISLNEEHINETNAYCKKIISPGKYILLKVEDTGEGIDEKHIDKIFEPYFTTKEVGKGSGLGLSVIHGIIKSYKGEIIVDSTPSQGTVFTIFFPIEEKEIK